jgi:hypothetical protein
MVLMLWINGYATTSAQMQRFLGVGRPPATSRRRASDNGNEKRQSSSGFHSSTHTRGGTAPGRRSPGLDHALVPVIERGRLLGQARRVFLESYNKFIMFAENENATVV